MKIIIKLTEEEYNDSYNLITNKDKNDTELNLKNNFCIIIIKKEIITYIKKKRFF